MNNNSKSSQLIRALHQLMPDAALSLIDERPWHSATFSGARTRISMMLPTGHPPDFIVRFRDQLPETEFELFGQLVADIVVTDEIISDKRIRLTIDALLLDA